MANDRPNRNQPAYQVEEYERVIPTDFLTKEYNLNDLGKKFVQKCFKASENHKPEVTVSQLRKLLSAVNSIQNRLSANPDNFNSSEIQYLRIKLAYQAGREDRKKNALKNMQKDLDPVIAGIENADDFKKFAILMESIIAYHKFYRGE